MTAENVVGPVVAVALIGCPVLALVLPETMTTGTSAAKEAGDMVDLDSGPTELIELIEIVEIGNQSLITRGRTSSTSCGCPRRTPRSSPR
ncbi:hypothetical protein GCM10010145_18700 [Streptomyces ruber]|uniref:Uncharacterized protein n=2 Tax=Streptomyces TaxID=1883 RepID=A0A918BCU2_9ACTN|nr:hypothetical protein GCM10010145_18700 [Streptomyces ruber]